MIRNLKYFHRYYFPLSPNRKKAIRFIMQIINSSVQILYYIRSAQSSQLKLRC